MQTPQSTTTTATATASQEQLPCSAIAQKLEEPLVGTAPTASGWLLLERPGAWGPRALEESGLIPEVATAIAWRARTKGMRVLLVRRRLGGYDSNGFSCFIARSERSGTWMEELRIEDPAQLLELDWQVFQDPDPPGLGMPVASPVYLVCTHGRRDPCCGAYGRQVVHSLGYLGPRLWESSHLGGHRFAANLACFPEALFYGRVSPATSNDIVNRHERNEVEPAHLRGRSVDHPLVQAADALIRAERNLYGIDDLVPQDRVSEEREGHFRVEFQHPSEPMSVLIRTVKAQPRRTSCATDLLESPTSYELVGVGA
ncbi:MAG: sucrase ferredoxin [Actinomycetota bacterium]|nr:sucrase ferredoxin [Actinomycetota bacterium]